MLSFFTKDKHQQENVHSISEFKKLIQYPNTKKNFFCTDNDTKKLANMLLKGFYKSSRTFARERGRQSPKINKRAWGPNKIWG